MVDTQHLARPRLSQIFVVLAVSLVAATSCVTAGKPTAVESPTDNRGTPPPVMLIIDGSGSMTTEDAPRPRIAAAKKAAVALIDSLPEATEIGLMTYGTKTGSSEAEKAAGCQDVTVLSPLGTLNRDRLTSEVNGIQASGYTPIALALRQTASHLPADDGAKSIVLISDGEDTCGEPPCEVATALRQDHPGLVISTIGFKTEGVATEDLMCIAKSTGGVFVSADNADQLAGRLSIIVDPKLAQETLSTTGYRGLTIGMSISEAEDAARAAGQELPDVSEQGTVEVEWVDCTLTFTNGFLVAITPKDGVWTIDGLRVGMDVSRAKAIYQPSAVVYNTDNTATVVYSADDRAATGYEITYEPDDHGQPSGRIVKILLCQCKPRALPNVLTLGYAEKPPLAWTTTPGQVESSAFGEPRTYYGAREDTGFIQTDELIIVSARGAPAERAVVGIDASDGSIRWRSGPQPGYRGGCSDELPGGRIACGGTSGFSFISTETGELLSSAPVNGNYHSVIQVGDTLAYLASDGQVPVVEGGTDTDPDAYWRLTGQANDADKPSWDSNGVVGTYCNASVRDAFSMAFDEDGHEILPAIRDGCYSVASSGEVTERTSSGTSVYTSDGEPVFSSDGPITRPETNYGGRDLSFTGTGAHDRSGQEVWTSSELSDDPFDASVIAIVGDTVVVQHQYDELVGLSASDGRVLWRVNAPFGYGPPLTDGERLITYTDNEGLLAYNISDGSTAWTIPQAAGMQYGKLAASNGRIVIIGSESIQGYGPR